MALTFPRSIRCAGEVSQARDDAPVSAIMVSMSDDYKGLLRRVIGEPTVSSALRGIVTSVSEGDEDAYTDALAAIGRSYGRYCVEAAVRDQRAPGVVLDTLIDRFSADDHLPLLIAGHPNVTANVEQYCRRKRRAKLNEFLAGSHGVSDEAVERLLKSRVHRVIGALLGNSSLSEDVLRRAELRAHSIGMRMGEIVWDGRRNASMPVDVVESWLTCSDEQVRLDALESSSAPRNILWERLTQDVNFAEDSSAGYNIFAYESNADGDMIDWFLSRWEKQARDELHRATRRRWVAEAALSHPRARATTLERLYARYGAISWWLRSTVEKAPSCPDWVRQDAARKLAVEDGALMMRTGYPCASPESVRALYECGYLTVVAGCENAPGDLLAEVLRAKLRKAVEAKGDGSNSAPRFTANDVIVPLSHDNMPVDVRRECARWLPEVLWAVARDGFLGRA